MYYKKIIKIYKINKIQKLMLRVFSMQFIPFKLLYLISFQPFMIYFFVLIQIVINELFITIYNLLLLFSFQYIPTI